MAVAVAALLATSDISNDDVDRVFKEDRLHFNKQASR